MMPHNHPVKPTVDVDGSAVSIAFSRRRSSENDEIPQGKDTDTGELGEV